MGEAWALLMKGGDEVCFLDVLLLARVAIFRLYSPSWDEALSASLQSYHASHRLTTLPLVLEKLEDLCKGSYTTCTIRADMGVNVA